MIYVSNNMTHLNRFSVVEKLWSVSWLSVYPKSVSIKSLNAGPHVHALVFLEKFPDFWIFQSSVWPWNP